MPCFRILIILPRNPLEIVESANDGLFRHLLHHHRGAVASVSNYGDHRIYQTFLCDMDAAGFLYDLPYPFYALALLYKDTNDYFYTIKSIRGIPNPPPPRDDKVLKSIYWNAKALERNVK